MLCGEGTPLEGGGEGGKKECFSFLIDEQGHGDGELCTVVAGLIGDNSDELELFL